MSFEPRRSIGKIARNHWLIRLRRFASREDLTNPPVLIVQWVLPASSPPLLTGVGVTLNAFRFEFTAEAGKTYAVESRGSLTAGAWPTLTNIAAQLTVTNIVVTDVFTASNGFYHVRSP